MKRCCIFPVLLAAGMLPGFIFGVVRAQDDGEGVRAAKEPDAVEVKAIVARAEDMLRMIRPSPEKGRGSWKVMEAAGGTARWGNLFQEGRTAALVNVKQAGEDSEFDPLRQDLCYFTWRKGRWEFRQFLGNASDLEIHYRKDHPSAFLQGSFRAGRYEGEFVSWYLDEQTGRLVPTGFEDWGPFYLKGDFLVGERGFERRAHDTTAWIHPYKNGKMGALLTRFHENDMGDFDVTFPDAATGRWMSWIFRQDREDESRMTVTVKEDKTGGKDGESEIEEGSPTKTAEIKGREVDSAQIFQLLTGLDPALLESGWQDKLAPRPPLKLIPIEVSGDPSIASRLHGGEVQAFEEQKRQRAIAFMKDFVPGATMKGSMTIGGGDILGVWGNIFGGPDVEVLLAEGMSKEGEGGDDADLFLLRRDEGWKLVQKVGTVSGAVDYDGRPDWAIRQQGSSANYYVLSRTSPNWTANCQSWQYDEAAHKLVPTGWPSNGLPSISGNTITFSSRDMTSPGSPPMSEVYRFADGKIGPRLGTVRRMFTAEGHLLRTAITVLDDHTGKEVTWRLWKMAPGYKARADVYALSRDEQDKWRGEFHQDATLEFDWGEDDFGSEAAAQYLWKRLTGAGTDAYLGMWEGMDGAPPDEPGSVKISGLPEAAQRFAWPQ